MTATDDLKSKIIAAFESQLHEGCVRLMNVTSLPPEIEGDEILDDEGYVPEAVEEPYEAALKELVADGILAEGEAFGIAVYGFSLKHQEKLVAEGKLPYVPDFE